MTEAANISSAKNPIEATDDGATIVRDAIFEMDEPLHRLRGLIEVTLLAALGQRQEGSISTKVPQAMASLAEAMEGEAEQLQELWERAFEAQKSLA